MRAFSNHGNQINRASMLEGVCGTHAKRWSDRHIVCIRCIHLGAPCVLRRQGSTTPMKTAME
eukprot:1509240-Amphidinium_carterae.1